MAKKLFLYQASIFAILYIGYGFYYYTRKSIVFMLPHLDRNTTSSSIQVTKNDIGVIISLQNLAYALSKLIGGFLSDVVSARILFGSGLFLSGMLNIAFKKEIQIHTIYGLAFLIGLTQGAGWPCCGKLLQNWFPKDKFGTGWSVLSSSANVAGALGPLIATWIALKYHWTYAFMIPGCLCMTIGYLAIIIIRNRPSEVGLEDFDSDRENISSLYQEEENDDAYTEESDDESDDTDEMSMWQRSKMFLNYSFFFAICLAFFATTLIKTIISDWSQVYLIQSINFSHYNASYFVSIFEMSGIFGSIFSGVLTDYIYSRRQQQISNTSNQKTTSNSKESAPEAIRIRMTACLVYLIISISALHFFAFYLANSSSRLLVYSISFILGFVCYGSNSLLGVCAMEFVPKKYSGSSHAIAALASNFGAVFAGVPFGFLCKIYSWRGAFFLVEVTAIFVFVFSIISRKRTCKFIEFSSKQKTE